MRRIHWLQAQLLLPWPQNCKVSELRGWDESRCSCRERRGRAISPVLNFSANRLSHLWTCKQFHSCYSHLLLAQNSIRTRAWAYWLRFLSWDPLQFGACPRPRVLSRERCLWIQILFYRDVSPSTPWTRPTAQIDSSWRWTYAIGVDQNCRDKHRHLPCKASFVQWYSCHTPALVENRFLSPWRHLSLFNRRRVPCGCRSPSGYTLGCYGGRTLRSCSFLHASNCPRSPWISW